MVLSIIAGILLLSSLVLVTSKVTFEQCTWEEGVNECMIFDYELPTQIYDFLESHPKVLKIVYDPQIDNTWVIYDGFGTSAQRKAEHFDFSREHNLAFTDDYAGFLMRPCLVDEITGELTSYYIENGTFKTKANDPRCEL